MFFPDHRINLWIRPRYFKDAYGPPKLHRKYLGQLDRLGELFPNLTVRELTPAHLAPPRVADVSSPVTQLSITVLQFPPPCPRRLAPTRRRRPRRTDGSVAGRVRGGTDAGASAAGQRPILIVPMVKTDCRAIRPGIRARSLSQITWRRSVAHQSTEDTCAAMMYCRIEL
jgi:hypothetical protein